MYGKNHLLLGALAYGAAAAHTWKAEGLLVPRMGPGLFTHPSLTVVATDEYAQARAGLAIAVGFAVACVGSLFPDLDSEEGMLQKRRLFGLGYLFAAIGYVLRVFVPHRGPMHSFLVGGVLALLVEVSTRFFSGGNLTGVGIAFGFGVLTHLLLDAASMSGVALFWPHPFVVRLWPSYRVGSAAEVVLTGVLTVILVGVWLAGR